MIQEQNKLRFHVKEVLEGRRRFEKAAEAVYRMILEKGARKIIHGGKTIYDFPFFREGDKHIIGWFEEINALVHFLRDHAQGGSAKEMGIVFISGPASGKTFFIDYLCERYRQFLSRPENTKYTFGFVGLDSALAYHEKVAELPSATFEDPMILAMNISRDIDETKRFLAGFGFESDAIKALFKKRQALGASTEYLWRKLMEKYNGDAQKVLDEHVRVMPIPITDSYGTLTGKYESQDKITASAVDLVGEESLERMLLLPLGDPNKFDLQSGALARVAGGGIHFSDEIFKNKTDLVKLYLGVIQNRKIAIRGFIWPIDTVILATSNNAEYREYVTQEKESPIVDRFRTIYVSHNTDYKLQQELTRYALGDEKRTTILDESMHIDPNLVRALSYGVIMTRLPKDEKLDQENLMKLESGEIAGEYSPQTLLEIKDKLNANPDVTQRWGQKGLGHRDLGKALQILGEMAETQEGKCMYALDIFKSLERVILDYVTDATERNKYLKDLEISRQLHKQTIKTDIVNAQHDDPQAIKKYVMNYIYMIVAGADAKSSGPDKTWRYVDPQTREQKFIKIDDKYIKAVEDRMGKANNEQKEAFRTTMRKIYAQKALAEPNYDFMDQQKLVEAVTEVKAQSEVAGAGSLVGALANLTNDESVKLRNRMLDTMVEKQNYCMTCALKTIEYYCEKDDES